MTKQDVNFVTEFRNIFKTVEVYVYNKIRAFLTLKVTTLINFDDILSLFIELDYFE